MRKPKNKSFEIIKSVIKYQREILKLQKCEFRKNLFNLYGTSLLKF